jgi:TonB family protein
MDQMKELREKEDQELRERIDKETNQETKAKLEAILERRLEERAKTQYKIEYGQNDKHAGWDCTVNGEGAAREREQEAKQQAVLASQARISMDRAIQIAVSQSPGKVFECSLVAERWEAPGELAKTSRVFYHVVILTGDESKPTTTHVLVSALDGTIVKADKEERRRVNEEGGQLELRAPMTSSSGERRPINGGVLNGKATAMPMPEYPVIARSAHASGAVTVEIMIDEGGNVISAKAVSGHPLLQAAAVNAARQASFTPTRLSGEPVKVTGVLVYNFVAQ